MPRKELLTGAPHVRPVPDHPGGLGQSLEDHRSIALGYDPPVEQHHRPQIRPAADQAPEPLLELQGGVGHEVVGEAVQAPGLDALEPGGGERLGGHLERELRQDEPASRNRRNSWSRCPSPCTSSGHRPPSSPRTASAVRRRAPWLVNSTNMPPSAAWASSTTTRATAASCPAWSSRGSGKSVGMPNRHCAAKSNGEAWISRTLSRLGGRSRPSRASR